MTSDTPPESEAVDLRTLVEHQAFVLASATVEQVQAEFARTNWNFLAVLEGGMLLGVCARRELIQQLGSRFGFALNARHSVGSHLMAAPLRVVVRTAVTTVFKAAAARADHEFYDDVLLVDEGGGYCGMIPMRTLARLQTAFLLGNIGRLESSRQVIAEKNRQMEEDLQMAREVQCAMQPQSHAPAAFGQLSLKIAHRFQPAGGVSGDFFDVLRLSEHSVGVLVCDVMGHGVRSALVTAMVRALLEPLRPSAGDPAALLTRLNQDLKRILRQAGSMIFVTAAYAVVDLRAGKIRYAQAGHPTPLRTESRSGAVRAFGCSPETEGPALGLIEDFAFVATEESIATGDRLVLFTDGVFEAAQAGGEEFGLERLRVALARRSTAPLEAMLTGLLVDVTEHCEGAPFGDDVCLVALELGRTQYSGASGIENL